MKGELELISFFFFALVVVTGGFVFLANVLLP